MPVQPTQSLIKGAVRDSAAGLEPTLPPQQPHGLVCLFLCHQWPAGASWQSVAGVKFVEETLSHSLLPFTRYL